MRVATIFTDLCVLASLAFTRAQDSVSFDLNTYGQDDASGTPYQSYRSNTQVKPPQVQINSNRTGLADGYVFLGIDGEPTSGQNWPVIYGKYLARRRHDTTFY